MHDVFIAYVPKDSRGCTTPDSRAVQELYDRFSSMGIIVFLSDGSAPAEAVEEALRTAKVMVVAASCRAYVEVQQERLEWSRFIEQMQTRRGLRLITLFDGFEASVFPVSMESSGLLPTQFFGASNYGFDKLGKALEKALKVIGKKALTEPAAASEPYVPMQYSPNEKNITAVIPKDTTAAPQSRAVKQLIPTIIVAAVLFAGLMFSISCLSCVCAGIFGTASKPPRGLEYRIQGDTCIITAYNGSQKSLVIPHELDGAPVTKIGLHAFRGCRNLKSITLPDSVTEIEGEAFKDCRYLKSVTLPHGLTTLGEQAFAHCLALDEVVLPDGLNEIGNSAFYDCTALNEVTLPDDLTVLGAGAFKACTALTDVCLPDSLTEIGNYTFSECTALTDVRLPEGLSVIGDGAFSGCSDLTNVYIPDSVMEIGGWAFEFCSSLTHITIPDGVTSIANETFAHCPGLTGVDLPDSMTGIGRCAFIGCRSLTEIVIPDGVTSIEEETFYGCDTLSSVNIPDSVTVIGAKAFFSCFALTNVTLSDNITIIGENAFFFCIALTDITLPDSLTTIGNGAFAYCLALTHITLPDSITTIGDGAFGNRYSMIDIAANGAEFDYRTITVHAPHNADFYGYDLDDGVNWVIDK